MNMLNCKVRCIETDGVYFTIGRIYHVVDGFLIDNEGDTWCLDKYGIFSVFNDYPIRYFSDIKHNLHNFELLPDSPTMTIDTIEAIINDFISAQTTAKYLTSHDCEMARETAEKILKFIKSEVYKDE